MQWMFLPFRRYFDFQGRSRRLEYWLFMLLNFVVFIALFLVALGTRGDPAAFAVDTDDPLAGYRMLTGGLGILVVVWWLVTIIPIISVSVRRLHDREMTGWWYLGFIVLSIVPLIGFLAAIAYIVVMALPGTPGPNKYGPSPKEEVTAETFA